MRVFVTGASGFVGSAVVQELLGAGHEVIGMVRSDAAAEKLAATGAKVHRGNLADLEALRRGATEADGVIHTAFIHDFSKFKESCEIDRVAIETLGEALAGSDRSLIVTSGTGLLTPGKLVTEDTQAPTSGATPRVSERTAFAQSPKGIRVMAVRLPPSVHGDGDHGFVPVLIGMAREKGAAAYIGEGLNIWPGVHRLDAAKVYRLALEKGRAGAVYHAIEDGGGVPFRRIAEVIGRRLGVPVISKSHEEGADYFGWFTHFAMIDNHTSSEKTRAALGWQPTQPDLLTDLDRPHYFGS